MYLFKKTTIYFIKIKINLLLFLSILLFSSNAFTEEKFIGFIDNLEGDAVIIKGDKVIKLNEFDQIYTNQKITIDSNSSATISFIDNSILTIDSNSEFAVDKFEETSAKPSFLLSIINGKFTFESGRISKTAKGVMKIFLPGKEKSDLEVESSTMVLGLRGTLVTGSNFENTKQVALVEDSLGKVGEIDIDYAGETITVNEPSSGINVSENNEIQNTTLSEEESSEVKNLIKEITIKSATKSEENIERAITKQLAEGTIPDANGDGVADLADVEAYKTELLGLKKSKLDYVIEQSEEDLSLLSDIIVSSNSNQSMELMENLIDVNSESASLLMTEIVEQEFDIFSHVSSAEIGNFENLRETIVTEMIQDENDFIADTMAQMMAVSDTEMGAYMMNEITNTQPAFDDERNLAMDVLATFTEVASDKIDDFIQSDPSIMTSFAQSAFSNANEEDAEVIADMMQQTDGKNSAYLMSTMMATNDEIISNVYENLAEQEFDIFSHIETAKMDSMIAETDDPFIPTFEIDPFIPAPDTDPFLPVDDPTNLMMNQENFYDDLKGEIFTKIIETSDQTTAEITAELMMNSQGDSAMFMMETMMETNPEIISDVMENFVEEDFDIFDHFEDTGIDEQTSITALDNPLDNEINEPDITTSKKGLTKEERVAAKAQRKAEKARKKEERKAARLAAKEERKAARKAAKLAAKEAAQEIGITQINTSPDLQEFKTEVFQDMMTYSDESTMNTMAQLVATADAETASLIFETVVTEQQNNYLENEDEDTNFALDLMSNLSSVDSEIINTLYEEQEDLVENIMDTALTNISLEDSDAIANIISSSGNNEMNELVFDNIASSNNQSLTNNVFTTLADSDSGAEALIAMASTNQSLYENIAQDVFSGSMTAASLLTNITSAEKNMYNNAAATDAADNMNDTSTYAAGDISWITYPMTAGTYSTTTYISIDATATSMNGVEYSASNLPDGLTIDYTTGLIFGTPTDAGVWNSTITATDMMDFAVFATANLDFDIVEDTTGGYNSDAAGGSLSFMTMPYPPATLTLNNPITPIYLYTTGGVGNITFKASGLPSGLFLTAGQISGTPDIQSGTSSDVTITASDEDGNTAVANLTFPEVEASGGGSSLSWMSTPYPPATLTVGKSIYNIYLYAMGGTGTISYTATGLPDGLFISGSMIMGTPSFSNASPSYAMITAEDNFGETASVNITFPEVDGSGGGTVTWMTLDTDFPSTLTVNDPISSVTLDATGSMEPITYSYTGTLPPGLTLAAGVVSGTPTTQSATTTTVEFTATDMEGNNEDLIVTFPQVDASSGGGVTWNTIAADFSTLTLTEGTPMSSITLSATGVGTITYSDDAMLPAGISLTADKVSGTPTSSTETETTVTFTATDEDGDSETLTVSFPVINASSGGSVTWITLDTDFPSTLTVNDPISSVTLDATGSMEPITYSYTGTLPPGLTLAAGVVSGTPTTQSATSTTITFVATDMEGNNEDLIVTLPQVDASGGTETVNFTTPEGTLGTFDAGDTINETVNATATQGSDVTYTFTATNSQNAFGLDGSRSGIVVTGNTISGIAPRLYTAATYTFSFTATIPNNQTNNASFSIDISQDSTCVSPTNNICT